MNTGMLWFDNSKDALSTKLEKAIEHYEKKYERKPTLILLHPSMLGEDTPDGMNFESDGLAIRTYRPILPGHIWVGIEDK